MMILKKIAEINYKNKAISFDRLYLSLKTHTVQGESLLMLNCNYSTLTENVHEYELFTQGFVSLAKHQFTTNNKTNVSNYSFDKDYNLYTVERSFATVMTFNYDKSYSKSTLSLNCYPNDGSQVIRRNLELDNKFITTQTLSVNDKNEIVLGGLYSCAGVTSASGAFSMIYSAKLKNEKIGHMADFDYDFLSKGLNQKDAIELKNNMAKCKDSYYPFTHYIKDMRFRKDGGFDFVVEKKMLEFYSLGQNRGSIRIYRYSDLFVLSFNESGALNWKQKIYRNESFWERKVANHFLGECFIEYGANNDINVIHNKFNSTNVDVYRGSPLKMGVTLMTSIDSNGVVTERTLNSDPTITKSICPSISYRYGDEFCFTKLNYLSNNSILQGLKASIYTQNIGTLTIK